MIRDAELVAASLGGSPVAFAVLVTRHRERAHRAAGRLLRDRHETEDVVQEALLHAHLRLGTLRERDRFGAWLAAIAANVARMRLRERGAVPVAEAAEPRAGEAPDSLLEPVQEAIRSLPRAEREAVLACDVLGLSREEAAALLGCSAGAVRVRLHRGRARLRERLREHAPLTMPTRKELEMIEVEVRDVVTRGDGNGREAPTLAGAVPVVLLAEKGGERVLPIWIGHPEAGALVLQIAGEGTPRPMSADLMARIVEALGGRLERVVISSLREQTFFASIAVSGPAGRAEVDARPSDALNLARRLGAPIYVDEGVLEEAGVRGDELEERLEREEAGMGEPREGPWRSLTAEHVRGWFPKPKPRPEAET